VSNASNPRSVGPKRPDTTRRLAAIGERWKSSRRIRYASIAAVLALAALVAWLAVSGGGGASKPTVAPTPQPLTVSTSGLERLQQLLKQPIYWLGEEAGVGYEFTQTPNRRVYLRYLPEGVKPGASGSYRTVGTYPMANAFAVTKQASLKLGNVRIAVGGNAVAFAPGRATRNAYVAFPGVPYQVEVYDPSPGRAIQLVASGAVTRVGIRAAGGPTLAPVVLAESALLSHVQSLGQPAYWVGPREGVSYELRRTATGVYVRYLPSGAKVGAKGAYLTVATYPGTGGFARTEALAGRHPIRLAGGGIAAVSSKNPKSVYAGFPDLAGQIEVFSPVAGEARKLVGDGLLAPVR
jgi:hypothetical protein